MYTFEHIFRQAHWQIYMHADRQTNRCIGQHCRHNCTLCQQPLLRMRTEYHRLLGGNDFIIISTLNRSGLSFIYRCSICYIGRDDCSDYYWSSGGDDFIFISTFNRSGPSFKYRCSICYICRDDCSNLQR